MRNTKATVDVNRRQLDRSEAAFPSELVAIMDIKNDEGVEGKALGAAVILMKQNEEASDS